MAEVKENPKEPKQSISTTDKEQSLPIEDEPPGKSNNYALESPLDAEPESQGSPQLQSPASVTSVSGGEEEDDEDELTQSQIFNEQLIQSMVAQLKRPGSLLCMPLYY